MSTGHAFSEGIHVILAFQEDDATMTLDTLHPETCNKLEGGEHKPAYSCAISWLQFIGELQDYVHITDEGMYEVTYNSTPASTAGARVQDAEAWCDVTKLIPDVALAAMGSTLAVTDEALDHWKAEAESLRVFKDAWDRLKADFDDCSTWARERQAKALVDVVMERDHGNGT